MDFKQEVFYRRRRNSTKYYTGVQWTKELIEFFWTRGNTLWKDRCAVAHAPGEGSPDNFSARSRQAAQQRVETAYAHAPLMVAHDRRVLDVPLEIRLQSRISELLVWAKTIIIEFYFKSCRSYIPVGKVRPGPAARIIPRPVLNSFT
jgi:hypothetical protein